MPFIGGAVRSVCVQFKFCLKFHVKIVGVNDRSVLVLYEFIMYSLLVKS